MASSPSSQRSAPAVALVVVGALLLFVGVFCLYARQEVADRDAFAGRAVETLERPGVRRAVEREIVNSVLNLDLPPEVRAARPLLRQAIDQVLENRLFQQVFRAAALEGHRLFFEEGREKALLDLGGAAPIVESELRELSPQLARLLPRELTVEFAALRRDELPADSLATTDTLRLLGVLLPLLSLLCFVVALLVAPRRRVVLLYSGVAIVITAIAVAAALLVAKAAVPLRVNAEGSLTEEELEDAVSDVLDVYLGDLLLWALALGLMGLAMALGAALLGRRRGA